MRRNSCKKQLDPWQISFLLIVYSLSIFFLYRLLLLVSNKAVFESLTLAETIQAFFYALRFDLSILFVSVGLFVVALNIPISLFQKPAARVLYATLFSFLFTILVLLLVGDFFYFPYVKRHIADELKLLGSDWQFMGPLVLEHLGALAGLMFFLALSALLVFSLFLNAAPANKRRWLPLILISLITFVAVRGSVSLKPINAIDAFAIEKQAFGQLVLNGAFTSTRGSFLQDDAIAQIPVSADNARKALSEWLGSPLENPLALSINPVAATTKSNIVIILLESWASFYVDSFGGNNFKVTPFFDKLSKESIKFDNFYANGSRSIEAIQEILTGISTFKGIAPLGQGLEILRIPHMGQELHKKGYDTFFLQTSMRRSFRLDSVAQALGFDHYYGMEDAGVLLPYKDPGSSKFGWDYETYQLALKELSDQRNPFFAMIFTGTTHTPFPEVPAPCNKYPHQKDGENGLLNTLCYADWSLEQFFESAKKQSWFDNTIFILTADHGIGAYRDFKYLDGHKVPLLVYQPGRLKASTNSKIHSHLDLYSTVLGLAGVENKDPILGQPLFQDRADNFVLFSSKSDNAALLTDHMFMMHSLENIVEFDTIGDEHCDQDCKHKHEQRLLSLLKYSYDRLKVKGWSEQNSSN